MNKFLSQTISKRYLIVFLTLVLLACGVVAYQNLPMEAYPDIANMQVRVITMVPGKAAEEVERLVTIPLEKELNGIPRSDPPRSISIFGLSVITVVFDDGVEANVARQQVLERISQADVPEGIQPQLDPNASPVGEVFRYTIEGSRWSSMDRKEIQDWLLNRKFRSVHGIADSTGFGGPTKQFQVLLDPGSMRALGLTQVQIEDAISRSNGSTGGSYIVKNYQDYMVRGIGLLKNAKDIESVVIASGKDGIPILVKNVAEVQIGPAIRKGQVGLNDQDDIVEGILLMRRGENPSRAIKNVREAWDGICAGLPDGMKLKPLYDRTALVAKTVNTIGHSVAEGIVLVVVLLMLFLFQVRSALICAAVIPLALLTSFILLNVFNVPANLLSLGAIDFGIIVDGAVVMVENIIRHLTHRTGQGESLTPQSVMQSIVHSAGEVAKPIIFSTVIIVLTFLPILSFERVEGKLFRPLAVTMNFNLIGAVIATLTVVPVLCYFVFVRRLPKERTSPFMQVLENIYEPLLNWSVKNKQIICLVSAVWLVFSLTLLPFLGSEFIPELEEGNIWLRVTILPASVSLDKSVEIARQIRHILKNYPESINVLTQIGSPDDGTDPNTYSTIEVLVDLKAQDEWRKEFPSKESLVISMDKALKQQMPGLIYNFSQYIKDNMDETIAGVKGEFGIKIYGKDLGDLSRVASQISKVVESVPGMVDVSHDQLLGQPQLLVQINREKAARYGINSDDILNIVETSVGGRAITELIEGERRFDVVLRLQQYYRDEADELGNILVSTPSKQAIPLSQLADITEGHGATSILRDKNSRRIAVKANIRDRDLGSAVTEAQNKIMKEVKLPPGFRLEFGGQFDRAQEALERLSVVVPVTLCLIFLLLYAAFDSASTAAMIMLTVPLAAAGGIVALFATGTHISISAGVGFIALFGVCIQNGVILLSEIRDLQKKNVPIREAVIKGSLIRVRPVLIATVVALAGLIPATLANGIGSQSQKPFAIVIVGGILPATILTLLVLPAIYLWVGEGFKWSQLLPFLGKRGEDRSVKP